MTVSCFRRQKDRHAAREPRRTRKTVLVAVFFFGFGILAGTRTAGSAAQGGDRVISGGGSDGSKHRLVEVPVASFVPTWLLNKKAVSVRAARNAGVLKSVFEVFDPSLRSFLESVPIVLDSSAATAKAYRTKGYIGVSPDWDNTVLKSQYRAVYEQRGMKPGDHVFSDRFKTDLLIHEFLHILQRHLRIDAGLCYEAVARWYADQRYGRPSPGGMVHAGSTKGGSPAGNRVKYIVWHELYNHRRLSNLPPDESWKKMQYVKRYQWSEKGVEEFAYIGQEILSSGSSSENYIKTGQWSDRDWKDKESRMLELSPEVVAVFRGIFNPALTQ